MIPSFPKKCFDLIPSDAKNGVLRVWSVSRSSPLESIKLKKMGIHALEMIHASSTSQVSYGHTGPVSSTSEAVAPSSINASHFALPPAEIVCTFLDGGIGLYDLGHRKWKFIRHEVCVMWSRLRNLLE